MNAMNDIDGLREKPKKGEELKDNHMASVLERIFPQIEWISGCMMTDGNGNRIKTSLGKNFNPDFVNHDLRIVVEVDGDAKGSYGHHLEAQKVIDDALKDDVCKKHGYTVVRIPSFVQLDNTMLKYYFDKEYPTPLYEAASMHGFAHSKIALPADYCELGVERFEQELSELPPSVQEEIIRTLKDRKNQYVQEGYTEEQAKMLVLPKKLFYLFDE